MTLLFHGNLENLGIFLSVNIRQIVLNTVAECRISEYGGDTINITLRTRVSAGDSLSQSEASIVSH